MSYDTLKKESGREAVTILEIDLDHCTRTYGTSPCTASGPAAKKCFNTFSTCQDTPNYSKTSKTIRFSNRIVDGIQSSGDAPTFPTITGISHSPTVLTPFKGFGIRATVKVQLTDHPFSDVGLDPYLSGRDYDPETRSTLWGKLLARHKYYEGRVMRVKQGYLDENGNYNASNFSTRQYIISKISGPTPSGQITIEGKDPLKFADSSKVQFPAASTAELTADIDDSVTSISVLDPDDLFTTSSIASQPWIRVDDEVMQITAVSGSGTKTLTVTRGTAPSFYERATTAESHSEETTVQNCHLYNAQPVDDIVYHLLVTVSGISSSYIDTAAWQEKMDDGYQNYLFYTLLTEPTGVQDLIKEITEHTFLIFWNERTQKIELDTMLPRAPDHGLYSDENSFLSGSVSKSTTPEERLSRIIFYYGHRSPTLEMDEGKNFTRIEGDIDLDLEGPNAYQTAKVKKIFSRWLPLSSRSVVSEITTRLLNEYKESKDLVSVTMDPKDDDLWTGKIARLKTRQVVNQFGEQIERDYRVLQAKENHGSVGVKYSYVLHSVRDVGRLGVIAPDTHGGSAFPDYTGASDELKSRYCFIAYDDRGDGVAGFPTDDEAYVIR